MTILRDFDTVVTTPFPEYQSIKGHQLGDRTMISFRKIPYQKVYTWQMITFDVPIEDGAVRSDVSHISWKMVDAEGFIWNDEIYKIEVEV